MWNEIVDKSGHPSWHGRNLNALNDGWVTGGLDGNGPPYSFCFRNVAMIPLEIREIAFAVMEIADESVKENGGEIFHR